MVPDQPCINMMVMKLMALRSTQRKKTTGAWFRIVAFRWLHYRANKIPPIWEIDFVKFKIPLFLCKWVENRRGVKREEDGMLLVDFNRQGYKDDPFVLAKQAKQVLDLI